MNEDNVIRLFSWVMYSALLWLFFRFVHGYFPDDVKRAQMQLNTEIENLKSKNAQMNAENEQMNVENAQLKTKLEKWIDNARRLDVDNKQLTENLKIAKIQNDTLLEALRVVNKAKTAQELDLEDEFVPIAPQKPEKDTVFDSGATTDEYDAMIQVMQGGAIAQNTKNKAVHAIKKTHGTDIFDKLCNMIGGAKQRVEEALNDTNDTNPFLANKDEDWENFDITKYVKV